MAHRDDEAVADEDEDFAELDPLLGIDPAGRLQDDEERIAVDLELRPLVRLDRVLDGQLVEAELAADRLELLLGWLVQADPGEDTFAPALLVGVFERDRLCAPASVLVDRLIDDHRRAKYRGPEQLELRGLQLAPLPWLEPVGRQPRVAAAMKVADGVADRLEHALDLMLAALVDRELDACRAESAARARARSARRRARAPRPGA